MNDVCEDDMSMSLSIVKCASTHGGKSVISRPANSDMSCDIPGLWPTAKRD